MSDLLNTGISALLSYRKALDTAGHNIANVNTPGYTRQRVELASRIGSPSGDGYIGSGVSVTSVRRVNDAFVGARIASDASAFGRADSFSAIATRLDGWLSDATTGLAGPMTNFFDGVNALAANPASTAVRQTLIGDAQSLGARMQSLQGQFDGLQAEVNARLGQNVDEINQAALSIARLNERIALASGAAGGQPPNDLLDQRDQLVQDIAQRIGISTTTADDGTLSVFAGSGQALVQGQQTGRLAVVDDAFASGRLDVTFNGTVITGQIGGGAIGGLLDVQGEVLQPAQAQLGRIAAGLVNAVNAQHAQGSDATGQAGGAFFQPLTGSALPARNNGGNAQIEVRLSNASALTDGDYQLRFDGANWQLSNAATGVVVPMTGSGSAADPFQAQGMSLVVSNTAQAGDRFLVQPTAHAAGQVRVAITDPARIAAAAGGSAANSSDNTNARALLALSNARVLDGGRSSVIEVSTALVSGVGNQAQQAEVAREAQDSLLTQSRAARDAVSGVNLDEEASDLVRFQQAYQAAAQVIAVADTVFQALLDATRR